MKEKIIENEKWLNNKIIAYRNRRTLIYSLNPWCVPRRQAPTKNTKLKEFSTRTEQVLQFTLLLTCMKPRHLKGGRPGKNGQNYQFSVLCSKSVFR